VGVEVEVEAEAEEDGVLEGRKNLVDAMEEEGEGEEGSTFDLWRGWDSKFEVREVEG